MYETEIEVYIKENFKRAGYRRRKWKLGRGRETKEKEEENTKSHSR